MKTKVTLTEIDKYLREQFAIRPELMRLMESLDNLAVIDSLMLEDEDDDPIRVSHFVSEVDTNIILRCENEHFSFFVDLQTIEVEEPFQLHYLDNLYETGNLVMKSYDNELEEGEPDLWEEYDLSSDSDVDYNGSYLLTLADCIAMYFALKMIPLTTLEIKP